MMETLKEIIETAIVSLEKQKDNLLNNSSIHIHEKDLELLEEYNNIVNIESMILIIFIIVSTESITSIKGSINSILLSMLFNVSKS